MASTRRHASRRTPVPPSAPPPPPASPDRVRVGVKRDRDGGVAEALTDDLGMDAGLQRQGGVRVPEVVQADQRQQGLLHGPGTGESTAHRLHAWTRTSRKWTATRRGSSGAEPPASLAHAPRKWSVGARHLTPRDRFLAWLVQQPDSIRGEEEFPFPATSQRSPSSGLRVETSSAAHCRRGSTEGVHDGRRSDLHRLERRRSRP